MTTPDQTGATPQPDGGQHGGGGEQGERIEGSLTDGGSLPGAAPQARSFGAGRRGDEDGTSAAADTTETAQDQTDADAGPSGEKSGYGNTPPR